MEDLTEFQADALKSVATTAPSSEASKTVSIEPASQAPSNKPSEPAEELSTSIVEFDKFYDNFATPFLTQSKKIGTLVEEQAQYVESALKITRKFLSIVAKAKKPSNPQDPELIKFLTEITTPLQEIVGIKESNQLSPQINLLATVSEGASAFTWIAIDLPAPYIADFKECAQFYANKVLKEFRNVDKIYVEWVQSYMTLLSELQIYVKANHTTGPSWNFKGVSIAEAVSASNAESKPSAPTPAPAPAPSAGGPPPPPPPPPPANLLDDIVGGSPAPATGHAAVFDEINQGSSITSHLKKVDKSQMTHKNPELRKAPPVTPHGKKSPIPPKKPTTLSNKKPPKKELQDSKWIIEFFEKNHEIVVEASIDQAIFIDKCVDCTIQIKGKANAITINGCTNVGVVAESLVSSVDIIKCKKLGFQSTGKIPTISMDQSDSCQIYIAKESLDVEIYTSQTTALNVYTPKGDEGEFDETPVPEQFVHKIVNGKLTSRIVEHSG